MFILICQDVIYKAIKSHCNDNKYAVDTLKKALLSIKWRKHIVFAPELKEEDICSLTNILTTEEVKLLKFIHKKRLDSKSLMDKLSVIVKITFDKTTKNDNHIIINPKENQSFELFEETHFIVENILDALFYKNIVCKYFQKKKLPNTSCFSIAYYPVQGGGAAISEVIKYEIKLGQHFCFVIGDSDKKCDGYRKEGDTAQGIRSVINDKKPFNVDYYIMSKTREIENLIPLCILEIFSNSKQKTFIKKYGNSLAFSDIKIGMEYKILYDKDVYDAWKKVFHTDVKWDQIDKLKADSKTNTDFEYKLKEQKMSKLIDGWGNNILNNVLFPSNQKQKEKIYKLYNIEEKDLTQYQKEEWENIGRNVFSWCCCFTNPVY